MLTARLKPCPFKADSNCAITGFMHFYQISGNKLYNGTLYDGKLLRWKLHMRSLNQVEVRA
jgi:hypothetical protein